MKMQGTNSLTRVSVSLLICGIVVLWGFQVSGEEWTEAQKELWKSVETRWEDSIQGNVEAIMDGFHDNAVSWRLRYHIDYDAPITLGKDLITAIYESWLSSQFKPISYELEPLAIDIFGDMANVFYRYKYEKGGILKTYPGKAMLSYIKQHNKWLIIGQMLTWEKPIIK